MSVPQQGDEQVIEGDLWRITVLGPKLVRFEWDPGSTRVDEPTQVVVQRPLAPTDVRVTRRGEGVQVITDAFQLDYDGGTPSATGLTVKSRGSYHGVWRHGMPIENPFHRLSAYRTNLGGTSRTLDTVDGATEVDDGVASLLGIAVLEDSRSFVVGDGGFRAPHPGRVDVYVFVHGLDHAGAVADLLRLTGSTPLVPRYALGNWWSRFHRYSADDYLQLMDRFQESDLPFSVAVIDMDWHVTDVDPRHGTGWTGYTWNRDLFPDPEAFLEALHRRGMAVTLNVHPADGIRAFEEPYERVCALMGRDPAEGLPVDFDLTDPDFVRAYFEGVHHPLEDMGVDFWWLDWQQGTTSRIGIDPLWLLNHLHVRDMAERGRRPLILSRYCGPGSHRFPVGFSGDTVASWASLAFQPWFTSTAANIGYGVWSHDIGGHLFGERDDELALRWLQFGVLSPINRLHSSNDPFMAKEPWAFSPSVAAVMGTFLRWRHALVPYLYTEWSTGAPIVRPMYHTHPESVHAYDVDNQYWLGRSLLVAPITAPSDPETGTGSVQVWLPDGTWADLLTGVRYDGNRMITMHRGLSSVPVLAREGSIIPHAAPGTRPADLPEEFELWIVLGADGEYVLVEDDGGLHPRTATTRIRWEDATGTLTVAAAEGDPSVLPAARSWRLRFVGGQVDAVGDRDATTGAVTVEAGSGAVTEELRWSADAPPRPGSNDATRRITDVLTRARTAGAHKTTVARILAEESDPFRAAEALRETPVRGAVVGQTTRLPESLIGPIRELLAASRT